MGNNALVVRSRDEVPGSQTLWVQAPAYAAQEQSRKLTLCPPAPTFDHPKPCQLPLSEPQWAAFQGKVGAIAAGMKSDRLGSAVLLLIVVAGVGLPMAIKHLGRSKDEGERSHEEGDAVFGEEFGDLGGLGYLVLAVLLLFFGMKIYVIRFNQRKDQEIAQACEELSRTLWGYFSVEYIADNTGQHAAAHGVPAAHSAFVPQSVQAQAPLDGMPTVYVSTPQGGLHQAQVPPGVMPGDYFTVGLPQPQSQPTPVAVGMVVSASPSWDLERASGPGRP